ncbi:MAG TPA: hypothetical protein GXZ66_10065 [Clostridiaceae bacterium]|jgi:hypothetical protein|nr:hypothetical protein [Clostridiaceae bacterium]
METKTKKLNILAIYLTLVLILSSCSLLKKDISPTPTIAPTQGLETMEPTPTYTITPTPTPTPYYTPDIPNPTLFPTYVPEGQKIVNPFRIYNSQTYEFDVLNLAHRYSEILKVEVFGKSYMGKNLYVVKLGKGSTKVLVTGTTHARENITTNYIMRTIEEYAISYLNKETYDGYNVYEILNKVTIYYVPLVNPDGLDIVNLLKDPLDDPNNPVFGKLDEYSKVTWKANARGVDLNKNYPFIFEEVEAINPTQRFASQDYHGPYPASEPETHAMINLCETNDFQFCINLHSKGKVMFWRDEGNGVIEGDEKLARLINKKTGYTMYTPTTNPLSYGAAHENWFRYRFKKPAICLELTAGNDGPIPYNLINREKFGGTLYDYYGTRVLDWEKTKSLMLMLAKEYFG